jgi:hypothetical protein
MEYNGGGQLVQSIVHTSMKFSQWNSLVLLLVPKKKKKEKDSTFLMCLHMAEGMNAVFT